MDVKFRSNMKSKKGVELTLNLVVVMIISVIVLIVVIYFFGGNFVGGAENIRDIANSTLSEYTLP
ncbi:MAG: hypothetical protein HRU03_06175 [Nanoarchaeales archaeon]|nr:hypothetical protein [Nanoarchaeales archaeon]